jgi:hypothetical protein
VKHGQNSPDAFARAHLGPVILLPLKALTRSMPLSRRRAIQFLTRIRTVLSPSALETEFCRCRERKSDHRFAAHYLWS